jgi:hypothetical protein
MVWVWTNRELPSFLHRRATLLFETDPRRRCRGMPFHVEISEASDGDTLGWTRMALHPFPQDAFLKQRSQSTEPFEVRAALCVRHCSAPPSLPVHPSSPQMVVSVRTIDPDPSKRRGAPRTVSSGCDRLWLVGGRDGDGVRGARAGRQALELDRL